jgi:hypothetical protein
VKFNLRVWKNRVLRKIVWPERNKVIGEGCIMRSCMTTCKLMECYLGDHIKHEMEGEGGCGT